MSTFSLVVIPYNDEGIGGLGEVGMVGIVGFEVVGTPCVEEV